MKSYEKLLKAVIFSDFDNCLDTSMFDAFGNMFFVCDKQSWWVFFTHVELFSLFLGIYLYIPKNNDINKNVHDLPFCGIKIQ